MKLNKRLTTFLTVTAIVASGIIYSVSAADPGTDSDPLVTKSYVDETISNLFNALKDGENGTSLGGNLGQEDSFVPVRVEKGQVLLGGEGAEIILRSGEAVSYCEGVDGIVDVTVGEEYFNDTKLTKNHLVIIPRSDGRGAKVTGEEAWFIVKGGYSIK